MFLLQFLFFAAQVVYSIGDVKQDWARYLLSANPVNSAIEFFRMGLNEEGNVPVIIIGLISAAVLAVSGIFYFRKTEAYFADLS